MKPDERKERWVRARCFPTPHDDVSGDLADDSQLIELTVLGPKNGDSVSSSWRLRIETQNDGAWETPISQAVALALISEDGWNIPPLAG